MRKSRGFQPILWITQNFIKNLSTARTPLFREICFYPQMKKKLSTSVDNPFKMKFSVRQNSLSSVFCIFLIFIFAFLCILLHIIAYYLYCAIYSFTHSSSGLSIIDMGRPFESGEFSENKKIFILRLSFSFIRA